MCPLPKHLKHIPAVLILSTRSVSLSSFDSQFWYWGYWLTTSSGSTSSLTSTGVEDKIELFFSKPAAGGTMHYILRCDPTVREMIHKNHDKLKLE